MLGVGVQQIKRIAQWLGVIIVFQIFAIATSSVNVFAAEEGWGNLTRVYHDNNVAYSYDQQSCPDILVPIEIRGQNAPVKGCMFGDSSTVRVARYNDTLNPISYAIAFPLEKQFTPIQGLCRGNQRCAYSAVTDVFLVSTQLQRGRGIDFIDDLSLHITKHNSPTPHYTLDDTAVFRPLKSDNNVPVPANTVALSRNGRWAAIELYGLGFARLNLDTGELRRISATDGMNPYGYGHDPTYELAITNDGAHVAVMGHNGGLAVREVSDSCGDTPTTFYESHFATGVEACREIEFDSAVFPVGFNYALTPAFTTDSHKMSFYVVSGSAYHHFIVAPEQYSLSPSYSYSAFGDSFTSGEGETSDAFYEKGTNTAANRCHVSMRSYPYLVGSALSLPTVNKACSGARTSDVQKVLESYSKGSTANVTPLSSSFTTLSVGGNDIGIMDKLKSCLSLGTCEWARQENRHRTAEEIKGLFPILVELIQQTKETIPNAQLTVVGYPSVTSNDANAKCNVINSTLLDSDERQYFNETLRYLNTILQAAASYTGTLYINIENALFGERLCEANEQGMNGLRWGDDIAPIGALKIIGAESFHPTPWGHAQVAQSIISQLTPSWPDVNCKNCSYSDELLEASDYWKPQDDSQQDETPSRSQRYEKFLNKTIFIKGKSLTAQVSLPRKSLMPNSHVSVELHSDTQQLVETEANADGSIAVPITLPVGYAGYHTIHIYGESPSGIPVDIYEGITIADDSDQTPAGSPSSGNGSQQGTSQQNTSQQGVTAGNSASAATTVSSIKLRTVSGTFASLTPSLNGTGNIDLLGYSNAPSYGSVGSAGVGSQVLGASDIVHPSNPSDSTKIVAAAPKNVFLSSLLRWFVPLSGFAAIVFIVWLYRHKKISTNQS